MNTSQLNLDFFPFYTSGQKIRVEFPGGYIKQGRVAVSQEPVPRFWLINGCRSMHELVPGCIPKGPALRKSRIDNPLYLNGKVDAYREEGCRFRCGVCGFCPKRLSDVKVRGNGAGRQFQCGKCGGWHDIK